MLVSGKHESGSQFRKVARVMFISKMNRLCERHGRLAVIVIGLILVIPFVFLWGPGSGMLRNGESGRKHVGRMFGERVRTVDFIANLRATELDVFMRFGQWLHENPRYNDFILQETLRRMRALHEARTRGLDQVSTREVEDTIREMFSPEGTFSEDYYRYFVMVAFNRLRLNEEEFVQIVRDSIIINRLNREVLSSVFVAPSEVDQAIRQQYEMFRVDQKAFAAVDYWDQAALAPSDAEVQNYREKLRADGSDALADQTDGELRDAMIEEEIGAFYATNVEPFRIYIREGMTPEELKQRHADGKLQGAYPSELTRLSVPAFNQLVDNYLKLFYLPAQKRVRVVTFDPKNHLDTVPEIPEEALRKYYDDNPVNYAEQVKARHILLRLSEDASAEVVAQKRTELEQLRQRITQGGADFGEIAQEYSEDTGSAGQGGSLGYFGRGEMTKPFEDAAFALSSGAVSDVVRTQFGLHLIQVEGRRPGRDFAEVKDEIRGALRTARARDLAWEAADRFSYEVFERIDTAQGSQPAAVLFSEYAKTKGFTAEDTQWFAQSDQEAAPLNSSMAVQEAWTLDDTHKVSEVIQGVERMYVACWVAARPGRLPEFSADPALTNRIKAIVQREEAIRLAREAAAQAYSKIQAEIAAGTAFEQAAAAYGFEAVPPFTLSQPPAINTFGELLVEAAAGLAPQTLAQPLNTPTGALVVYLAERQAPDGFQVNAVREQVKQQVLQRKQQAELEAFYRDLEMRSDTQLETALMEQLL
jgi:parvulin-like peptidyl-prolyl isomerase